MESQKASSDDKAPASEETLDKPSTAKAVVKGSPENTTVPSGGPTSITGRGSATTRPYSRGGGGERGGSRLRGRGRGKGDGRSSESFGATETRNEEEKKERKERKPPEPKMSEEQPPVSLSKLGVSNGQGEILRDSETRHIFASEDAFSLISFFKIRDSELFLRGEKDFETRAI